ncbi:MAG: hypothetical protein LBD29_08300 [Treponema sp.]|jgi:hypothetical protein|nr:hypothetical protein [Treponema sp.]
MYGKIIFIVFWFIRTVLYAESALTKDQIFLEKLNPFWNFLWNGSWEHNKSMINRGDLRIYIPWQTLSLRLQIIDKRPVPPWEHVEAGTTAYSGGLYHRPTGSRILYGIQQEQGLAHRLRSPWTKALPFVENHRPSSSNLKTEPSSAKEPEMYLYIGTPQLGSFKGFASVLVDNSFNPAVTSGAAFQLKPRMNLQIEGFYTRKTLPLYIPSAWFSKSPVLPERDFHLYALSMVLSGSLIGIAADWAYSDTFAYGRDMYVNLGFRLGDRPWRFSLAADAAGERYVDRDGSSPGAGFRLGGKLERYGPKMSLFRFSTDFRASGIREPFDRSSTLVYYRFPANFGALPVKPARVSLTLAQNASNLEKIEDTLKGVISIRWGPFSSVFSGTLTGIFSANEQPFPFPVPEKSLMFDSAAISGELSYTIGIFRFKTKLEYTLRKDKEPLWNTYLQTTIQGKLGRLSVKIASPDLPMVWTYSVYWGIQKR